MQSNNPYVCQLTNEKQPIRGQVWESLWTNMDLNMDISK